MNCKYSEELRQASEIYNQLADCLLRQKRYEEALQYAEKSLEPLARIRSMYGVDEYRRCSGGSQWSSSFGALIRCALVEKNDKAAFNYAEEYKARTLLDLLAGKKSTDAKDGPFLVAKAEPSTESRDVKIEKPKDGAGGGATLRDLDVEKSNYPKLPEDKTTSERLIKNYENIPVLGLEELQPLASEFTFVTYVVGLEESSALVLTRDSVTAIPLPNLTRKTLRAETRRLREALGVSSCEGRDLSLEKAEDVVQPPPLPNNEAFLENSKLLYEQLVEPVLPHLKNKILIISPDDVLNRLPFEALGKDGAYLVNDYDIAYAPSANILKFCMDKERHKHESVLALGNPNLQNPAFSLVNAESEVNDLKGLFPRVDAYTFDQATEGVVKAHAGEYDILHFACHGELNMDDPMLTSLRLAPDAENDGYLHAGEVFDLNLQASLVVLSACNSSLGDLASGNELMGLTRSFLYAGAPSILASSWTVDDRSTAMLMREFYRRLGEMSKVEALREAKLAVMKEYPNPFHWAPFCLQGDYR
jgi:hypothetical protein